MFFQVQKHHTKLLDNFSPPGIDFKTFSTFSSIQLFTSLHARNHVYVLIFTRNLKNTVTHVVMECSMCSVVECSMVVLYIRSWAFPAKLITLKPASISLHDSLTALARQSQAQIVFRPTPTLLKSFYGFLKIFILSV